MSRLALFLFLLLLIGVYTFEEKVRQLNSRIKILEAHVIASKDSTFRTQIIKQKIDDKTGSILSVRCQDSKKKKAYKWQGTASKVGEDRILTADHLVDNSDGANKEKKVLPVKCEIFSKGNLVGSFDEKKHKKKRIGQKDLVILKVEFNEKGKTIPSLVPKKEIVEVGQSLILVSHPMDFVNDHIVAFGLVLNKNANKMIEDQPSRKEYWKDAILTDMIAAPGSSGAPLFTLDGDFIGIHVGGERGELRTNYQITFDADFILSFNLFL